MRALCSLGVALVLTLTTGVFAQPDKPNIAARDNVVTAGDRDDLYPPWWRGQPGTTLQAWDFLYNEQPYVPEFYDNPYGEPWIDTEWGHEWLPYFGGRDGVLHTYFDIVHVNLPNSAEPLQWKIVWVQVTWHHPLGEDWGPWFRDSEPPGDLVFEETHSSGPEWYLTVFEIWIPGNPDFEQINFNTDELWIDQIVVDTWCTDSLEPLGACCVEDQCVATTTCDECIDLGGWWYEGENCYEPPFECPCMDSLWHNGEPDFMGGLSTQRGPQDPIDAWVVDDVTFEENVIIRDLHWWADNDDSFEWQNTVDIIILADAGGMPGEVIVEMWDVYSIRYDSCREYYHPVYIYCIDGLEIPLPTGTYWIGMRPVNQGTGGRSYNLASATGDEVIQECYFQSYYWGYPDWTPGHEVVNQYHDLAFCVTSAEQEPCPADFDGDGDVDTTDLLFLLGAWGTPNGDVDGDGDTNTADLLALLAAWGECP
jgi:hypothetical protein